MKSTSFQKLRMGWDIAFGIVGVLGLGLLLYSALNGDRYRFDLQKMKAVTYVCMAILVSRGAYRLLAKLHIILRYLCAIALNLLFTGGIFCFNNLLHYHGYASMFGYPEDVKFYPFLRSDLHYTLGLGVFRYVLCFALGIFTFLILDTGLYQAAANGVKRLGKFLFRGIIAVLNKVGLAEFFGLIPAEEVGKQERQMLIEILDHHTEVSLFKEVTKDYITYEITTHRDSGGEKDV